MRFRECWCDVMSKSIFDQLCKLLVTFTSAAAVVIDVGDIECTATNTQAHSRNFGRKYFRLAIRFEIASILMGIAMGAGTDT